MQNPHCLDPRVRFQGDIMIDAGILKNVVNVDVAGPEDYRVDHGNTVADVNCNRCKTPFGWKYVLLLMWDGKNMLYADTNEPVKNA
ncbi:unnamed protein product [Camellia sinensis]